MLPFVHPSPYSLSHYTSQLKTAILVQSVRHKIELDGHVGQEHQICFMTSAQITLHFFGRIHVISALVWSIDPLNYKTEGTHGTWVHCRLTLFITKNDKISIWMNLFILFISMRATSGKNIDPKFKVIQGQFKVRRNERQQKSEKMARSRPIITEIS